MIKVTKKFLDDCTGLTFNADLGCFEDEDRVNWWLEGVGREMHLVNRETHRIPRDLAEELIAATQERTGGFVLRDGKVGEISMKHGTPKLNRR